MEQTDSCLCHDFAVTHRTEVNFSKWQKDFWFIFVAYFEIRVLWYVFLDAFLIDACIIWWIYIITCNLKHLKCFLPSCCQAHVLKRWRLEGTAKDRLGLVKCHRTLTHCSLSSCVLVLVWAEMTTDTSEGVGRESGLGGGRLFEIQSSVFILWSHPTVIQIHAAWGKNDIFVLRRVWILLFCSHLVCSVLMVTVECVDSLGCVWGCKVGIFLWVLNNWFPHSGVQRSAVKIKTSSVYNR